MQVDFYGQLADRLGARSLQIDPKYAADGPSLRKYLSETQPDIAEILAHPGTRMMLDDEITDWQSDLGAARTIAIIPVVSGG